MSQAGELPPTSTSPFARDYDLASRRSIRPRGRDFELVVTPRFERHYLAESYEALSADLLASVLASRRLFVDVGAHCGFFTLLATTRHPRLRVIALEPVEESHELLLEGVARNGVGARVESLRAAASDSVGHADLLISHASDNCSLYPHPATPTLGTRRVPTTTLDRLLASHPDAGSAVVKIDTDGHEMAVLDGLAATLAAAEDVRLLVELNPKMQRLAGHSPEALVHRLSSLGFAVFLVDDRRRRFVRLLEPEDWRLGCADSSYANLYCVPRERTLAVAIFAHAAQLSGAERTLLGNLTLSLEDDGAVCTVVLPEDGPLRPRVEALGAATVLAPLPWWCAVGSPDNPEHLLAAGCDRLVREVLPALELAAPDLIESMTVTTPWGAVAAELLGVPHVWQVCEYGEADHGLSFFSRFDDVRRAIGAHSDLVLTASDGVRRALFCYPPVDHAVTMGRWIPLPDLETLRRHGSDTRPHRAPWIVVAATVIETKDQITVVRALRHLRDAGVIADLLLAGAAEREYEKRIRRTARDLGVESQVRLLGFVEPVVDLLLDADVVVSAARHEAFGRSALEAAAAGRPLVCARGSGPAEVLADGEHALWFEPGDAADLASKIARLLGDQELARGLGESARRQVGEHFDRRRISAVRHSRLVAALRTRGGAEDPVTRLVSATDRLRRRHDGEWREESRRLAAELQAARATLERSESLRESERAEARAAGDRERAALEAELADAVGVGTSLRRDLADAWEGARAWEELATALHAERASMTGSLTWRCRGALLSLPGVAALHRALRRLGQHLWRRNG